MSAVEGVKIQCGREYWGDGQEARATELFKMSSDERKNLPSENLATWLQFLQLGVINISRPNELEMI